MNKSYIAHKLHWCQDAVPHCMVGGLICKALLRAVLPARFTSEFMLSILIRPGQKLLVEGLQR